MNMDINQVLSGIDFHKLIESENKFLHNLEWDFSI
ncbi:Aco operon expression regulatory protein, partial [human gut metagenome]